jgi:hypothetical protein
MTTKGLIAITFSALLLTAGEAAFAAQAKDALEACKVAVNAGNEAEVITKLMKIKARGANYEVWLNIDNADQAQKGYCFLRRGEVEQLIVEEGSWVGRNPRRPETAELAAKR